MRTSTCRSGCGQRVTGATRGAMSALGGEKAKANAAAASMCMCAICDAGNLREKSCEYCPPDPAAEPRERESGSF